MFIIPWPEGAAWNQEISLSGRTYELQAHFNPFSETWVLNLSNADGEILNGINLVSNQPFLFLFKDSRLPNGEFLILGQQIPRFESFQNLENSLIYVSG